MNKKIDRLVVFFEKNKWIPISVTFVFIYSFWIYKIDFSLIIKDTILTGGDSASWYQTAKHLKDVLIPHGRLFGWSLSNFFGYNELQHYFPLPFLFSVVLSYVIPLTIALKITMITGLLAMPVVFYFAVQKITKNMWSGLFAAPLSLIFVFNESYTMFGGNFLSTMAGEFCYSFAVALFVLFVGVCFETMTEKRSPVFAGILLGMIGLSHLFLFMIAFFIPFFFIFSKAQNSSENIQSNIKKNISDLHPQSAFDGILASPDARNQIIYSINLNDMEFQ